MLLAIDDSQSMSGNKVGHLACEAMVLVARALARLEVGQLGILRFGDAPKLVHAFDEPFTDTAGPRIVSQFSFDQKSTNTHEMIRNCMDLLQQQRDIGSSSAGDNLQLMVIISDGRLSKQKGLSRALRMMQDRRVLVVFVILDSPHAKDSILELQNISFVGKVRRENYLDTFPFPFYVVLRDITALPNVLADAIRQFFDMSQRTNLAE